MKKGILAVSFGTSYEDTRKKTIEAIEKELRESFPDREVYRAWTSKMIIKKLKDRDGYYVDTVIEAMEKMIEDGITDIIVQPTHVINGHENDQMKIDAMAFSEELECLEFGTPLLTSELDSDEIITKLMEELGIEPLDSAVDQAVVFMGHGTTHYANAIYAALDYKFKDRGYKNIFVGTVEAYPSLDTLKRQIKEAGYKKVLLTPFMIVAGDHAKNDMADDHEDSWKSQFTKAGFEVRCLVKGLGEYHGVRKMFVEHAREAMK